MNYIFRQIAAAPQRKRNKALHHLLFGRRFSGDTSRRLLIIFEPRRISYASVFPFLEYAESFRKKFDVEIRCIPAEHALQNGLPNRLSTATHVIAQSWLTDPRSRHEQLEKLLASLPNYVTIAYLDSFANNDIRLAGVFESANLYFKKSLFTDLSKYIRPTRGHTHLAEFYGNLYGIENEVTDWAVSPSVFPKLRLAPNFLTDPDLSAALIVKSIQGPCIKDIDLHARLGGTNAKGVYGEMRRHAANTVGSLKGLHVVAGTGVSRRVFAQELRRSKACFSPFGYGELCWRDIEAIAAGTVLIKPDMSHLRTEPDLYRDGETYVACRWDFADLPDKLGEVLADEEKRIMLTANARRIAKNYLKMGGPVSTYAALFET